MHRMADPVRILLSGPGLIGRKHASLLDENPDTVLAAVVAPDYEDNEEFAVTHNVPRYSTLEAALAQKNFDAVIISSPNDAHFDQAAACIAERLPVLVEKPLTETLESAAQLVEYSEAQDVPVLVGHHRTYSPLLKLACEYVASEQFGRPVALQGTALFYKPEDYFAAGPWRTRKGGGPILINLIHEIGIMRHVFGEIDRVSARVSSNVREFEVEDTAAVTLSFANGALGTFMLSDASASSKSWEMTAGENPAYPFFSDQDCYHFAGTKGSLDFPSMRTRSYAEDSLRSWWVPFDEGRLKVTREDPLALQLRHFVAVARGEEKPLVTARDGYLNMLVINAIMRSAESGCEVNVNECAP